MMILPGLIRETSCNILKNLITLSLEFNAVSLFDIELILSAVISGISNIHLGVSNLEIIIFKGNN